ncbi:MAG: tetratricopeptide repeat protein [Anaerolineales bacterium]
MIDIGNVVHTKIVPPQRRVGLLRRPRLVDFIHENLIRKVVLISAAPGYGKTSLLIDFLQDTDISTCWYSLDEADADPWSFVAHFVGSLTNTFPQLEGGSLASVSGDGLEAQDALAVLGLLVNEIQANITEFFSVIIDDYQYAEGSLGVRELLNWFMDHQPDNCCLILASRSMPDLPYLKLTARQEIAGLGSEDLAFTAEEIQTYLLENHDLDLSEGDARQLRQQTEGWITAVLLSTHTLGRGLLGSLTPPGGGETQVFEYLAQEVFEHQPPSVRRFLKSTGILRVMHPEFCDALLEIDNSLQLLEDLERDNLFVIRLSGSEPTFRYHALFHELLQGQFEPDALAEKRVLHRQAARLYLEEGAGEEALEHFVKAEAWPEAIDALHDVMESVYRSGRLVNLAEWIDTIDPQALAGDAPLLVLRGRLYRHEGENDQALESLRRAQSAYLRHGQLSQVAEVKVSEALVYRRMGNFDEARRICQEVLGSASNLTLDLQVSAQAHKILGDCHHLSGDLVEAKREFRRSLELYEQVGDAYHTAAILQDLGTTARRMGNHLEAEGHYEQALQILQGLGNRRRAADIKNNIGVGHYYQGEYEEAQTILEGALVDAQESGHKYIEGAILASLGDVHSDLGNLREARKLYHTSLERARESRENFLEVYIHCALANLFRVDHAWEQAHALLDHASTSLGAADGGYLNGLIALFRGMILTDQGRAPEAVESLSQANSLLRAAGAQRDLARAELWQAHALLESGSQERAFETLGSALKLTEQIAHPHLLVVDGSQMLSLLQEARAAEVEQSETLDRLLTRISQFTLSVARRPHDDIPRVVSPPRLEVRALGSSLVLVNGKAIPNKAWGGPLVRDLFFYLADRERAKREIILAEFWPEYSMAKAKGVFHATLYRMRRVLPQGTVAYESDDEAYFIDQNQDIWYDVAAFEQLANQARVEGQDQTELIRQALGIYRGHYLADSYSNWSGERREELRRLFVDATIQLGQLDLEAGRYHESVKLFRKAIEQEPYREDAHRGLMVGLAETVGYAEAATHFLRFADRLWKELEVRPTEETLKLYESIRQEHRRKD